MRQIKTLEDLRENASETDIRKIVTEYMMETIGKAEQFEAARKAAAAGKSVQEIKDIPG